MFIPPTLQGRGLEGIYGGGVLGLRVWAVGVWGLGFGAKLKSKAVGQ